MMRVVNAFQRSLTRGEMREVVDERCCDPLTSMFSTLAQTSITATRLLPIWREHKTLKGKVLSLESQVANRERELGESRVDQSRTRESFMKTSEELATVRGELATARNEARGTSSKIGELELELVETKRELTGRIRELEAELAETQRELIGVRSSFEETVTTRVNEQAAHQISIVMEAVERRFPGGDHTWIYGGDDDDGDDDDTVPADGDHPDEAATAGDFTADSHEDAPAGGLTTGTTEDAPGPTVGSIIDIEDEVAQDASTEVAQGAHIGEETATS